MTTLRRTVSHSEVESYLSCERKHYYGYGLEIQRRWNSDSLQRGTIGHLFLEHYFSFRMEEGSSPEVHEKAKKATFAFAAKYMQDHPDEIGLATEALNCVIFFFQSDCLMDYDVLGVEKEYVLEVVDPLDMPFKIDAILRHKHTQAIVVVDFKFLKDFYSEDHTELMPQLPKYVGGLRAKALPVHAAAYLMLRTGGAKGETDWQKKIKWMLVPLSDARVQRTFEEQVIASMRIQKRKQMVVEQGEAGLFAWSKDALRVFNSMICQNCSFKSLCIAELNDAQPNMVLDQEYVKRERIEFNGSGNGSPVAGTSGADGVNLNEVL